LGYFTTVLADAPSHWWRLADPGGVVNHDIGAAAQIPLLTETVGNGPYSGMTSDGLCVANFTGEIIAQRASVIALAASWSLEIWAWAWAVDPGDDGIFGLQQGTGGTRVALRWQGGGTILGFVTNGTGTVVSVATPTFRAWHHFVLTFDGLFLRLYVDAVAAPAPGIGVPLPGGNYRLLLGNEWAGTTLTSFLEDAAIYTFALSPAQVTAHFLAADQLTNVPVFQGGGSYPNSTSSSNPILIDLAEVLAAVKATYT
jgi:Concanavalin A-like lectin/glucanases superfamily